MIRKLGPMWLDPTHASPLTALTESVGFGHLVSQPVAHALPCTFLTVHSVVALGKFTSCPKDPHYVLGHYLIYMIILNDHVLWYLGLTLGSLVPNVLKL